MGGDSNGGSPSGPLITNGCWFETHSRNNYGKFQWNKKKLKMWKIIFFSASVKIVNELTSATYTKQIVVDSFCVIISLFVHADVEIFYVNNSAKHIIYLLVWYRMEVRNVLGECMLTRIVRAYFILCWIVWWLHIVSARFIDGLPSNAQTIFSLALWVHAEFC